MVIGISIDINELNKCYDLIMQNRDIIGHIQIYLDDTPIDSQKESIIKLQNAFSAYALTYSLHSYGYINLCETVDEVRNSWIDIACQTIALAKETSCIFVNYHMGYTFSTSIYRELLLEKLCESLKKISQYAIKTSVTINIENDINTLEMRRLGSQVNDLDVLLNCNYPNVKLCYDVGHANIAFSSPFEYRNYINFIQSFHIHNNWKISDEHIPFGKNGSINLNTVFVELQNYDNIFFILENELNMYSVALTNLKSTLNSIEKPI